MNNLSNRQKFEAAFAKRSGESPTEFIQKNFIPVQKSRISVICMISWLRKLHDKTIVQNRTFRSTIHKASLPRMNDRRKLKKQLLLCKRNSITNWCATAFQRLSRQMEKFVFGKLSLTRNTCVFTG